MVENKYPETNFDNVDYIFSAGVSRSRYFPNEGGNNPKYPNPVASISTRARLVLYDKPSLGVRGVNIFVGAEIQIACSIIHELTHHHQYETKSRMGNETDTTQNEIEYLKQYHLTVYNKIIS